MPIPEMAKDVMSKVDQKGIFRIFMEWRGKTLIFLGDSITESPTGYAEVIHYLARHFTKPTARVINAGIGGNTVEDGLSRCQTDVIRERPQWVFTSFGLNDSVRVGPDEDQVRVPMSRFEAAYRALLERLVSSPTHPRIFPLTTSGLNPERAGQFLYKEDLDKRNQTVKRISAEMGLKCLDIYSRFESAPQLPELQIEDGVHLTMDGERFMAEALLKELIAVTEPGT